MKILLELLEVIANTLNYSDITFPVSENDYSSIENRHNINIYVFSYDNNIIYPIYVSFDDDMDLLEIHEEDRSHYVYIKDFNRLIFNKTKNKNKKHFCKRCLQCFSSENILIRHKDNCLVINGTQSVKLNEGSISFKNYSRQIPVPFKIYVDFECVFKKVKVSEKEISNENGSYTRKYQKHNIFLVDLL